MKNLTETQSNILDSIQKEFSRINQQSEPTRSFNLIDVNPLIKKNQEIAEDRAIMEANKVAWEQLAIEEADAIIVLLRGDLPSYLSVERKTKDNGYAWDMASIVIYDNTKYSRIPHHESHICIEVLIGYRDITLRHNCVYKQYHRLNYKHSADTCATKEELFSSAHFISELRKYLR